MAPLDPRLSSAFRAYDSRLWRVFAARVVSVVVTCALAMVVRHWATWVLFGVVAFTQGGGAAALLFVSRSPKRFRARLESDIRELTWVHSGPEPRTKLHRFELHDRAGEATVIFVTPEIAADAMAAARALAHEPTVTTNDAERAEAELRHRLSGKLRQLEVAATTTAAPKLAEQGEVAARAVAAWRALLFQPLPHPYREKADAKPTTDVPKVVSPRFAELPIADLEARLDKLIELYAAARLGESHRIQVDALTKEKNLPEGIFEGELFTAEIATRLGELHALALVPQV